MKPPFFDRLKFHFEDLEFVKRLVIFGTIDPIPLKKNEKYLITLFENSTCPHFYKVSQLEHEIDKSGNCIPKLILDVNEEGKESHLPSGIKHNYKYYYESYSVFPVIT